VGLARIPDNLMLSGAAAQGFDLVITCDKNMKDEQNLARLPVAVIELDVQEQIFTRICTVAHSLDRAIELSRIYRFVSVNREGADARELSRWPENLDQHEKKQEPQDREKKFRVPTVDDRKQFWERRRSISRDRENEGRERER
jgi:hypothetical protein